MSDTDFCETCFVANVTPVTLGANMKAANASAAPAVGVDALFASLLNDAPKMPGSATQALNNVLPQAAVNLPPANAAQIATNALPAAAQSPETQIVQAKDSAGAQQISAQPQIIVQPLPSDQPQAAPIAMTPNSNAQQAPVNVSAAQPNAAILMTTAPGQPAVQEADSKAPAPQASKPKDKPKADPAPQITAVSVFVPLPQISALPKIASDAVGDVTSKPAQPVVAQQALDHAQSAVIQTQAEAKSAPPATKNEQPAPQTATQNLSGPAKFDLSPHTGGQNAQSDNREQAQSRQPAPAQSAAPQTASAPPQTNTANNNSPAPLQTASVLAVTPAQAPVHANIVVQSAPQNTAPVPYDIGAIAITIAAKAQGGDHHFDIRLDPPELGSIAVHLTVNHSGQAVAHLTADKPETLQLLQNDSSNLQSALKDAGLNLANNGLNFSLRGDQRQAGQSFQRSNSRARNLSVSAVAAPTPTSAPISSYAPGALDITI